MIGLAVFRRLQLEREYSAEAAATLSEPRDGASATTATDETPGCGNTVAGSLSNWTSSRPSLGSTTTRSRRMANSLRS